mgnify:CR=1 FL=1
MSLEQEAAKNKVSFKQALRRRPIEFYEAMQVGVSTVVGAGAGASLGYLNLLDTTLKHGDIEKAAVEGIGAVVGGAAVMGGFVLGITASNRGWRQELKEGEAIETSPEIMTQETSSYTKRFAARVAVVAASLGLPVATMLSGVIVTASGHTETGPAITMAGAISTGVGVTISNMVELFPRNKQTNNRI